MPLVAPALKKELEAALLAGFTRVFPKEFAADPTSYKKQADAISDIAMVLVKTIVADALVLPGIATAGSPAAQTSVSPGKIL